MRYVFCFVFYLARRALYHQWCLCRHRVDYRVKERRRSREMKRTKQPCVISILDKNYYYANCSLAQAKCEIFWNYIIGMMKEKNDFHLLCFGSKMLIKKTIFAMLLSLLKSKSYQNKIALWMGFEKCLTVCCLVSIKCIFVYKPINRIRIFEFHFCYAHHLLSVWYLDFFFKHKCWYIFRFFVVCQKKNIQLFTSELFSDYDRFIRLPIFIVIYLSLLICCLNQQRLHENSIEAISTFESGCNKAFKKNTLKLFIVYDYNTKHY